MPWRKNPSQFEEWLTAARKGSMAALGQILECCQPYLVKVAAAEVDTELLNRFESFDLVQETFAKALKEFHGFRGTAKPELCAWLRQMLLHIAANARRSLQAGKRLAALEVSSSDYPANHRANNPLDPGSTPSKKVRNQEYHDAIQWAVKQLPSHYQEVIRLYFHEHCLCDEIGRRMGVTTEAARKLRTRAVREVAKLMRTYGAPE
jgi:RNA polymerase sigma-70 factor (ECF subfamily)